ncbi:MAG: hypothetical protein ACXVJD_16105 [Mucilaginibacter sp.]
MFKKTDPNTYTKFCTLMLDAQTIIGTIYLEYQVTLYEDVQSNGAASVQQGRNQKFIVNCTQRINIYNPQSTNLQPTVDLTNYQNYPAMINTAIALPDQTVDSFFLLDYSPQTINTQIETSGTTGTETGVTNGSSTSSTTGSSISQTNSYGGSVTVGDTFSGATATYEHSSTVSSEKSNTNSTDTSNNRSNNAGQSASMSIKDWGAYGQINPQTKKTSWTFGQEYPWDAIVCKDACGSNGVYVTNPNNSNQVQINIPTSMLVRLYDGVTLYPPSELSIFGINFVMKNSLLVVIGDSQSDEVTVEHIVNYFSASHTLTGSGTTGVVSVFIDKVPYVLQVPAADSLSTTLSLNFLALSPLGVLSNAAIVGFIPSKFIIKPVAVTTTTAATRFKIISTTNDLIIQDTTANYPDTCTTSCGFTASQTSLTAGFAENCTSLQMTVYFKVIDSTTNYMLYLKHWKGGTNGVMLSMVINNVDDNPVIIKYVDAQEAEGGENNLLSIALRNQDFASVDYHDYLQLGLNSIQITITPIDNNYTDCTYEIRAISVENA